MKLRYKIIACLVVFALLFMVDASLWALVNGPLFPDASYNDVRLFFSIGFGSIILLWIYCNMVSSEATKKYNRNRARAEARKSGKCDCSICHQFKD